MSKAQKSAQKTALVVGAGIGGMATAIRLAKQGFSVTVLEANAYPGGKLSQFQVEGYRFDAGPSLFTMPERVEELFSLAGQDIKQHFKYRRLDHVCHYFYENGKRLVAHAQAEQLAQDMQRALGEPAENVTKYLTRAARKYVSLAGGNHAAPSVTSAHSLQFTNPVSKRWSTLALLGTAAPLTPRAPPTPFPFHF